MSNNRTEVSRLYFFCGYAFIYYINIFKTDGSLNIETFSSYV